MVVSSLWKGPSRNFFGKSLVHHRGLLSSRSSFQIRTMSFQKLPFYDSHGDYQADDASGHFLPYTKKGFPKKLALYEYQNSLPRFPVPSLESTIDRLQNSSLPFAKNDTDKEEFRRVCALFPNQAKDLQRSLIERSQREQNWLQSWWNRFGYLRVRDPSPINVNYFFQLPRITTATRFHRGARLLESAHKYSKMVHNGSLPQETIGKTQDTPLCSSMYKYLFYACRIPRNQQDTYRIYYPNGMVEKTTTTRHAVVSCRGHYFTVDLIETGTGRPYTVEELKIALKECQQQAESLVANSNARCVQNLGILTASHRDEWASNRKRLRRGIPGMKEAIQKMESGLLLLCLDDDKRDCGSLSANARSYLMGIQGRWYDKSLQFILTKDGDLGLNGEHSMMDGMPVVGLCKYILQQEVQQEPPDAFGNQCSSRPKVEPIFAKEELLEAIVENQNLQQPMVEKAMDDFNRLRNSLDLEVQSFRGYGATWIKKYAKCSPDAFVQMAIQLAVGKWTTEGHKPYVPLGTYESTQVRSYRYGRTETTRSVSVQSVEWVTEMLDRNSNGCNDSSLVSLFRKAADAHVDYIRKASKGAGVDRHLFGLQMLQSSDEKGSVALFDNPVFLESKKWMVSTSTLPVNPGFGPVVIPDGVGIAYDVQGDHMYFTCTSYQQVAPALSHYLEESLLEIKDMILAEKTGNENGQRSML